MNSLTRIQTVSLDSIISRMDARLRVFAGSGDHRERFLLMYRTFKNELRKNIQLGRFLDAEWTEAICCRMAEMYFEADGAYCHKRQACPEPWGHCFDSAVTGRTNLLQDMLLGMNAHINYDLPLCTYDTLVKFRDLDDASVEPHHAQLVFDSNLKRRYFDFLMINQIAWESIPLIQDITLDRFSKLLKVANILSLRFTKFIAEKVIVDSRDRAWGHTLLLVTVRSAEEITTINRLTTIFAMEAVTLIAPLTLNPVKFVHALRGERRLAAADFRYGEVVRLLVARLKSPPTARVARRALVEYGPAIHSILEQILDENPRDSTLRVELSKIMVQHPTPTAARALYRRLDPSDRKSYDLAIFCLASMYNAGIRFAFDEQWIRAQIEQEVTRAKAYFDAFHGLGPEGRGVLLGEALSIRFADTMRRILYLTSWLHADHGLLKAAARIGQGCRTLAPDAVLELLESALRPAESTQTLAPLHVLRNTQPDIEGAHARKGARSRETRLAELAGTVDPWLQVCAVHQIGELHLFSLLPLVLNALHAPSSVVQETALRTAKAMLTGAEFRSAITSYLETSSSAQVDAIMQETDMLSTIEKVLYLKNCELFREIPSEDLAQIAGLARSYRFAPEEKLIEEGQPGEALYVILNGEIDVVVGTDHHLARVGRHAVLGEMSLLSDMPCSATCVAVHSGRALRIGRADFLTFLLDYPEIAMALIRVLIQRLRDANQRVLEQTHGATSAHAALLEIKSSKLAF